MDVIHEKYNEIEWEEELFTCLDGGTMGIKWYVDKQNSCSNKPILLMLPGLGFGSRNLYTHHLANAAIKDGFKVGVILLRSAENIPITSFKVTTAVSDEDVEEAVDYVYQNYVIDPLTG